MLLFAPNYSNSGLFSQIFEGGQIWGQNKGHSTKLWFTMVLQIQGWHYFIKWWLFFCVQSEEMFYTGNEKFSSYCLIHDCHSFIQLGDCSVERNFQQYFSCMVAVCFIGGEKTQNYIQLLSNFITLCIEYV